jgi:hypothetical protein
LHAHFIYQQHISHCKLPYPLSLCPPLYYPLLNVFWLSSSLLLLLLLLFLFFILGFLGFFSFLVFFLGLFFLLYFGLSLLESATRVGDLFGWGGERRKLCFCVLCVSVSGATTHLFIYPAKAMVSFSMILCASTRRGILLGGGF